ncbi:MAG: PLP-dependent aminotransferase family protein [Paracoccaceae bacterium]
MRTRFPLESIILDQDRGATLPRQIYAQLRGLIERRALDSGGALPSTRELSRDLGVGRNSVIAAYDQLSLEGYVRLRKGATPLVVSLPVLGRVARSERPVTGHTLSARGRLLQAQAHYAGEPGIPSFHPGMPDPDNFPFNTWSRLLARRARLARHDLFGAYHVQGYPPLREAIARYLTVSRGVNCSAEQIVVTNGAQSAFDLLARMLVDPGDTVWMEEPGYHGARAAFLSAGAVLSPLHVGDTGWHLTPPPVPPKLIFVTPSCHYPLGVTMPMEQRLNLIRLSEAARAWIIEDDYDSEYRFQGQPIPALQGLDVSGRVVFVGTFAKTLFPAMRLGYMVVPPAVGDRIEAVLSATGQFAPLVTQAALADFMNEGHLTRHLRRTRRLYAQRRESFFQAFDEHLGTWTRLCRTDTGIQQVARFRIQVDDRAFAAAARAEGVNVSPFSMQFANPGLESGLLFGFAAADARDQARGFRRLRELADRFFADLPGSPRPGPARDA